MLSGFRGRRLKFGVLSGWFTPSLGGESVLCDTLVCGGNTDMSNPQLAVISILLNPLSLTAV